MNILAIDKTSVLSAYQRKWELLANYEDVEITLLTPNRWKENFNKINLEKNSRLKMIAGKVVFPGYGNRGFYYTSLIRAVVKCKPDIIHMMEEPYSLFSLEIVAVKKLFAPKAKIIFYTYDNISYNYKFHYKFSQIYKLIELFTFKNTDYGLCANEEAKSITLSKGFDKPVKVIYPCFDYTFLKRTETGRLKEELGLKGSIIGFAGRIVKEKGLDTLIKACSEVKEEVSLLIIGRGEYKSELIRLAEELGINEKTRFVDVVKYSEIPKFLSLLDIFVLPSITTDRWKEQFGRVIIEAMACEVPVIGSSSGAIPEVIGDNGLIFRENDYIDLKNKILILMQNREYRNRLIVSGKSYAKNFSGENFAKKIYTIYRELLNNLNYS